MGEDNIELKIRLPSSLIKSIEMRIVGSSYKSVQEYIESLVKESVDESPAYSKEEEETVRKRLSSLGYE